MAKGPRKMGVRFGTANLTHYGGVYLLHRFFTRVGFKHTLAQEIRVLQRNHRYSVGEMLLALLYPMLLGLERIETTQLLQENGVFQFLTGLRSYPDPSTLRRFLLRVAPVALPQLRKLHDRFLGRMLARTRRPARLIFDLDSTVLVVYGRQENARIGYNPLKRGRRSYYPLLCFEAQTRDFWHGELRPGDAGTPRGALECVQACFRKMPHPSPRVILRADKGFFDHKLTDWVEQQGAGYVVVARLTPPIQRRLRGLRYRRFGGAVETAAFRYQPHGWTRPARFVVIRRLQPDDPSEQLRLFQLGRYHYQVLVTNLALQPLNLWRFYNQRAAVELIIKQLKGDYALGHIPTRHYLANETYFHLLLLAYNLMSWFQRLCLPPAFQTATLQTLRHKILLMPAQLSRTQNRPTLTFPASGEREFAWKFALNKINQLKP